MQKWGGEMKNNKQYISYSLKNKRINKGGFSNINCICMFNLYIIILIGIVSKLYIF